MEAKHKAYQLFEKFYIITDVEEDIDIYKDEDEDAKRITENYLSKKCALILIEEQIKLVKEFIEKSTEVYQSLKTPKKLCIDIFNPKLKYLEEVKQEIEKL